MLIVQSSDSPVVSLVGVCVAGHVRDMLGVMSTEHNDADAAQDSDQQPPTEQDRSKAATHFEMMIQAGQNKPELSGSVMSAFMTAEVYFLSREPVTGENKNAQPMVVTNPAGESLVVVFTSPERIPDAYIDECPYGVKIQGANIIKSLDSVGFVVNPGDSLSFEVPAKGVQSLKERFFNPPTA